MSDERAYLVWSNEHRRWWGPSHHGYVTRVSDAGRYSLADALDLCANAVPGQVEQKRWLPDLPVRLADVEAMHATYKVDYPSWPPEWWD